MNCKDAITGENFINIRVGTFGEKKLLSVRCGDHEEKLFFGPLDNKEVQLQRYMRWKNTVVNEVRNRPKGRNVTEVAWNEEL